MTDCRLIWSASTCLLLDGVTSVHLMKLTVGRKCKPHCNLKPVTAVPSEAEISYYGENPTQCGSDDDAEAVWDGLNRAILDSAWREGSFRVVALIGDSLPHDAGNDCKNPLHLN